MWPASIRILRDARGLTLAAVGTLALAIGAAAAVFSVALFIVISVAAVLVPAWRGANIDPVAGLRKE